MHPVGGIAAGFSVRGARGHMVGGLASRFAGFSGLIGRFGAATGAIRTRKRRSADGSSGRCSGSGWVLYRNLLDWIRRDLKRIREAQIAGAGAA